MTGAPASTLSHKDSPETQTGGAVINLLSYVLVAGGIFYIAAMAWLVWLGWSPLPFYDQWTYLDDLSRAHGAVTWHFFWVQHMEHRIVFPKMFYLLDLYAFGGKNFFLLFSIFGMQLVHLAAWVVGLRRFARFSGALLRTAIAWCCFCLFRPTQIENFIWGYQVCFILPMVAATLAFVCLLHQSSDDGDFEPRADYMLLALLLAIVASFSLANGLIVPLLVLLLACCVRAPGKWLAASAVTAAACWCFYFFHFQSQGRFLTASSLAQIPQGMLYYFGVTWERISLALSMTVFAIAAVFAIFLYVAALLRRRRSSRSELMLLSAAMFCLGSALMAVLGRAHFGLSFLYKSRYQSIALLFWLAAGMLLLNWIAGRERRPPLLATLSTQIVFLICMLVSAVTLPMSARTLVARTRVQATATLALVTRAADASLADQLPSFFLFENANPTLNLMRGLRTWEFSDPFYRSLGENLHDEFQLAPSACSGGILQVSPIAGETVRGSRVTGWSWIASENRPAKKILLAAPDGSVVGLARNQSFGENFGPPPSSVPRANAGWFGFISPLSALPPLKAYALFADGRRVCELAARP